MNERYSHKVVNSFALWFDHMLLDKAGAYQNVTTPLFYQPDETIDDVYVPYASPFKQWVYDSSVVGAQIPQGVSGNGGVFYDRPSGTKIDWDNGRVFLPSSFGSGQNLSGTYAIKDLNVYVVADEDQKMVFEGNFQINSRYGDMVPMTGVNSKFAAPACFIMNTASDNKPFAFGGMDTSENKFRVIVVADSTWNLDGCTSLFKDLKNSAIPLISLQDSPLNEYGDLKSGSYNYAQLADANMGRYLFVDRVTVAKFSTQQQTAVNSNLRYGVMDFYLSEQRVPKLDL